MSLLDIVIQMSFWNPIILFFIGIPSSIFNIIIFLNKNKFRQSPICYYIIGQSISDISTLLILLLQIIPSTSVSISSLSCKLTYFFSQTTVPCAMTFLCLTAFDRWASTSSSVYLRHLSSIRIARFLFPCPFIFWSFINISFLIYSDLIPPTYTCWFTNNSFAVIVSYFLAPFLYTIFPLIILIIFAILTFRNIHSITYFRRQHGQNRQLKWEILLTKMIIIQTSFSICCTVPRAIFLLYWLSTMLKNLSKDLNQLSIELLFNQITTFIICLNYTSSFYIFFIVSPRFRRDILKHLEPLCQWEQRRINPIENERSLN